MSYHVLAAPKTAFIAPKSRRTYFAALLARRVAAAVALRG